MIQELDGKVIQLNGSLLGFGHLQEFSIHAVEGNRLFALLQSKEEEGVGFVVASPFSFFTSYTFEIAEEDKEAIDLLKPDDALILAIMTIKDPFNSSTMNLLAPIVVNIENMKGIQIVLPPKYEYQTRTSIAEGQLLKGGGVSC
ncbi:flagellar assembly protein FliW [Paenibacillus selenitireducens]|uniref:Flagellar assembly factor FliW n=1 Tax=Paenibacillus selenitireducens TaxID=1324314 RepID=A0A1T2X7G1_9BACL|nr:flagellar assembly protein FliW [Paenibacillus selenitireducens]